MPLPALQSELPIVSGIGDASQIFDFESDFAHDLRCIPMVVRFKLDRVGIKLSLRQWSKMGEPNRRGLLFKRCDSATETAAFHDEVVRLATEHCSEDIVTLANDPAPDWADRSAVPGQVAISAARFRESGISLNEWADLPTIKRYALVKLCRSKHDHENVGPALREFGLD